MKRRSKPRPQTISVCAEFHEDDGVDPRRYFKAPSRGDTRKTLQLCKQVLQTLRAVLSGGMREAVLGEVEVQSVLPAPDSSRLLITVVPTTAAAGLALDEIRRALKRAQPWLRSEVAGAVSRKRAPDLVFEVHPAEVPCNG